MSEKSNKDQNWNTSSEAEFHTSAWIGAIVLYLINFGEKPFRNIYTEKNIKRNSFIGWVTKLIIFFLGIYLAFYFLDYFL